MCATAGSGPTLYRPSAAANGELASHWAQINRGNFIRRRPIEGLSPGAFFYQTDICARGRGRSYTGGFVHNAAKSVQRGRQDTFVRPGLY